MDALVQPGGLCEGAIVVHQEDNAEPHIISINVSREGLAPIVKAYSRLIPVDGLVL